MRVLFLVLAVFGAAVGIAGCEGDLRQCSAPAGCVRAERVDSRCVCVGWETVSTQSVSLPFVVASVTYSPLGTATVFCYGFGDPSTPPDCASSFGTSVRAVIRRPDGSEQVARLGFIEPGLAAGHALTDTVMRLDLGGVWTLTSDVDLPSRSGEIAVWVNPAVTVATNYAGEKTVTWSSRKLCVLPGLDCSSPQLTSFTAALIRGETSWGAAHDAYLREIGPEARSALLAFDPQESSGAVNFPRYELIGEVTVDATPRPIDTTWRPCRDAAGFEVLAETAVPLSDGDTFVLQYGALPDAACTPQRPGLVVGTSTPDCSVQTQVFVDRLSGTLFMQPSTATGACTRNLRHPASPMLALAELRARGYTFVRTERTPHAQEALGHR